MSGLPRRPRLALPFTILTSPDVVRMVAGEDFRYTFSGPALERWLPNWLARLDGRTEFEEAVGELPEAFREPARQLADRLRGERILIDGTAADAHAPARFRLTPVGNAAWAAAWQPPVPDSPARALSV